MYDPTRDFINIPNRPESDFWHFGYGMVCPTGRSSSSSSLLLLLLMIMLQRCVVVLICVLPSQSVSRLEKQAQPVFFLFPTESHFGPALQQLFFSYSMLTSYDPRWRCRRCLIRLYAIDLNDVLTISTYFLAHANC